MVKLYLVTVFNSKITPSHGPNTQSRSFFSSYHGPLPWNSQGWPGIRVSSKGPYRDFESNRCWVGLQTLGPPCGFHLFITRSGRDVDPAPAAAGCSLQRRGQLRRFMLACMGEDGMLVARLYIVCHPQPASSIQTSSGRGVLAAPPSTTLLAMMVARGA